MMKNINKNINNNKIQLKIIIFVDILNCLSPILKFKHKKSEETNISKNYNIKKF